MVQPPALTRLGSAALAGALALGACGSDAAAAPDPVAYCEQLDAAQAADPFGPLGDEFEPAEWFAQWLETPAGVLGGLTPEELITTVDGREVLAGLLGQMQTGAYG